MRSRAKACDVLRGILISYCQDRYRESPDAATMRDIISYVDAKLCNITEEQAESMI